VLSAEELGPKAINWARAKKRNNALVAIVCGAVPALLLGFYFPTPWSRLSLGLTIGLIWGNAFEYAYHRWLLHWPRNALSKGHLEHHRTAGSLDQAQHMTFGRSPLNVVVLFLSNGILLLVLEVLFRVRIAPGVLVGWSIYMVCLEEIHWRLHMNEWVPPGLGFARSYHLSHHDTPNTRYNVFLPLFDFLFGSAKVSLPSSAIPTKSKPCAR
jgi:fatty acid hydroxylase family protein